MEEHVNYLTMELHIHVAVDLDIPETIVKYVINFIFIIKQFEHEFISVNLSN